MIFRFELKGGNVPGTEARAAVVGDDVVVGEYFVIVLLCVMCSLRDLLLNHCHSIHRSRSCDTRVRSERRRMGAKRFYFVGW